MIKKLSTNSSSSLSLLVNSLKGLYSIFVYLLYAKTIFFNLQSGLTSVDPCVAQLLLITYEIYKSFYCNPPADMTGIFFDISKAFDKVRYMEYVVAY